MKKSHRKNLIFRLTLIPTLVISSTLLTIAPEDVYAIHHLLPPEKVAFSPLYGYCAWRSRLIFFLHAFAPESSALGKLVRTLFYKQPFDGTLIPTQNPRSVVRTISHQLWGEIVSLVKSNKSSMEELSTLIDAKTAWQNECKQGLKIIENTLQSDAEYQEIFDQIAGLEKEKSALIGKTGTEALMSRKNIKLQITKLNKALRARVDNLPQEKKALIFGNERDQKKPGKTR